MLLGLRISASRIDDDFRSSKDVKEESASPQHFRAVLSKRLPT
uniref:Uncharacterized protein n=1 Tax=Anopheles albimanus TaxID=7167 RepID=A0A182FCQ3_ANOAL